MENGQKEKGRVRRGEGRDGRVDKLATTVQGG